MRQYGLVFSIIGLAAFAPPLAHAARLIPPTSAAVILVQEDCGPGCRERRRERAEAEHRERAEAEHRERAEAEHRRWEEEHHRRWEDAHHGS